jgi:hypothetical protein
MGSVGLEKHGQHHGRLHRMFTLSKTQSGQRQGGRLFSRNWLKVLAPMGLGIMLIAFFSGCGSNNTPEGTAKAKKDAKAAAYPAATKKSGATALLLDKEGTNPVKMRIIKHQPESNPIEPIVELTQEELDARLAADRKLLESPETEIYPGLTQGEAEAKVAAEKAGFDPKTTEVIPGVSLAQIEAKLAAEKASYDPKIVEVVPGMSQAQVEAQNAKQKIDKRDMFPPALGN